MRVRAPGPAIAVLALVAGLVACGGDDAEAPAGGDAEASADADAYVDELARALEQDELAPVDGGTATCMATAVVDMIGVDALVGAGVSPEELGGTDSLEELDVEPPDDAVPALADGFAACDMAGVMVEAMADPVAGPQDGEPLSSDIATCLEENIDDRAAAEAFAVGFVRGADDDLGALLYDAVAACPDLMTAVIVDQASGPVTPEDEVCIHDVLEANPDLVRSSVADDAAAAQELRTLITEACPGFPG